MIAGYVLIYGGQSAEDQPQQQVQIAEGGNMYEMGAGWTASRQDQGQGQWHGHNNQQANWNYQMGGWHGDEWYGDGWQGRQEAAGGYWTTDEAGWHTWRPNHWRQGPGRVADMLQDAKNMQVEQCRLLLRVIEHIEATSVAPMHAERKNLVRRVLSDKIIKVLYAMAPKYFHERLQWGRASRQAEWELAELLESITRDCNEMKTQRLASLRGCLTKALLSWVDPAVATTAETPWMESQELRRTFAAIFPGLSGDMERVFTLAARSIVRLCQAIQALRSQRDTDWLKAANDWCVRTLMAYIEACFENNDEFPELAKKSLRDFGVAEEARGCVTNHLTILRDEIWHIFWDACQREKERMRRKRANAEKAAAHEASQPDAAGAASSETLPPVADTASSTDDVSANLYSPFAAEYENAEMSSMESGQASWEPMTEEEQIDPEAEVGEAAPPAKVRPAKRWSELADESDDEDFLAKICASMVGDGSSRPSCDDSGGDAFD